MKTKQLILGISTYFPWVLKFKPQKTGGTISARYCYSIWLRHLVMARNNGLNPYPKVVAELGPGDSLGIGLAALLSGAEKYYAFDVIAFANVERNLGIFEELVALFRSRADIPGDDEFPQAKPSLAEYVFPADILSDAQLDSLLDDPRIERIKESLRNVGSESSMIKYKVPWSGNSIIDRASVDMIFSQAVLEHVDDLEGAYAAMKLWLKPSGFISHQIDFRSHGYTDEWNGHWLCTDFIWKLIRGKRIYFINRQPLSRHIEILKEHQFDIVYVKKFKTESSVSRDMLDSKFKFLSDDDFTTSGAFVQAKAEINKELIS